MFPYVLWFPRPLWLSLPWLFHRLGGALVRAEVSIGTGVLFSQGGAFVELYCLWVYCPWPLGRSCLWKKGLLGGLKVLNPPGAFRWMALMSCRDLVTLIALSFIA